MTEEEVIRKLTAFYVFAVDGPEKAEMMYPQYVNFAAENAGKKYEEVKAELLSLLNSQS